MADWSASQYLKFKHQRTRPALDLAQRLAGRHPRTIVDLGCGPGNSTAVLSRLFPDAELTGLDNSPAMVVKARAAYPALTFQEGDVRQLSGCYDLLFSNACLQWVPDHATLFPSLMDHLNDGGTLAVQMPMNDEEPLMQCIAQLVTEPQWGLHRLPLQTLRTLTSDAYYDLMLTCSASFDLWETIYYHPMVSAEAMVEWVRGARLRPYLAAMDDGTAQQFLAELTRRVAALYPARNDGSLLLRFRRFFLIAEK